MKNRVNKGLMMTESEIEESLRRDHIHDLPIESPRSKWDKRFLLMARMVSTWSKDPSTQCGAIITRNDKFIVSVGFNGFPKNTDDSPEIYEDRPKKYLRVLHAEINAILSAKQDLNYQTTIYAYPLSPCSQCAAAIVQAGINRVVTIHPSEEHQKRWGDSIDAGLAMFHEAGVAYKEYLI